MPCEEGLFVLALADATAGSADEGEVESAQPRGMLETSRWVLRRELVIRGRGGDLDVEASSADFCCCAAFIHVSRDLWSTGQADSEVVAAVGG